VIERLNREIAAAELPGLQVHFAATGAEASRSGSPDEFGALVEQEWERWQAGARTEPEPSERRVRRQAA
jgi:hypothetical protein